MRKWIIISAVLLSVCALVLVAVVNLNSLIDRNRDYLLDQAQRALGRQVSVGDVGVTVWGGVGLRLSNFALADDPSFSSGHFIRAKDLQVNVKLLPLLKKEFQVKRLILHDPVIEIIRNKEGRFNFSTIGKEKKQKPKDAAKEPKPPSEKERTPALLISVVDISNGDVHYLDQKAGTDIRAKQIDFKAEDLDLSRPFSAELAAALFSEKQNLKLKMKFGPIDPRIDLSEVPVDGEADIDPLDFGKLKTAVPAVGAALPKDSDISGILKIKNLQLKGTLKDLALKGTLEGTDATMNFGKSFRKPAGIPLVVSTDAQYANDLIRLSQTKVQLHTVELAGKGDIRLGEVPVINLALDSNRFSLEGWEKIVPLIQDYQLSGNLEVHASLQGKVGKGSTPQIQGTLTFAGASARPPQFPKPIEDLNTRIHFTGQRAELKDTTLSLGNARIRLGAEIERFSPLTLSYRLSAPEVWPADFQASLPEERKGDVIKNLSSEGTVGTKGETLTVQGKLASTEGRLYKINYKNLGTNFALENKVANIRNFRVNALNGSLHLEGKYAFSDPTPRFALTSKAQGLDLAELYRTLDAENGRDIRGRLNANMKISGSGKQWNEIRPSLRGQGQAEVLQGALLNFNLADGVLSGASGIPGLTSFINPQVRKKYPETFEAKDTEFKELKGLFDLADARINVKELRIVAADYAVDGNGWVDFEKRVDFQALLTLSQRLSADLGHSARELTYMFNKQNQFEMPFALTGTLPNVKPRPDSNYIGKMVQRGFLRRGTEELQRRFFGKERSAPAGETEPGTAPSDQKKEKKKNSTEDLIRKGLDQLFKR
jgi:autotransporter translocation and assembly factor TamB